MSSKKEKNTKDTTIHPFSSSLHFSGMEDRWNRFKDEFVIFWTLQTLLCFFHHQTTPEVISDTTENLDGKMGNTAELHLHFLDGFVKEINCMYE
jgi:hypothetical protein